MDWISSLFRSKEDPEGTPEPSPVLTPKFQGLSPDDSLNKSSEDDGTEHGIKAAQDPSTDEDFVMDLDDSPPEEKGRESEMNPNKWIHTNYKPQFDHTSLDFGRVERQGFGSPLIVRIYQKSEAEMRTQVGVFDDVDPLNVEECLNYQNGTNTRNLVLIIEKVNSDNVELYEEALETVLSVLFSRRSRVVRFVFWMDRWDFVTEFASIFADYCTQLIELNIGAPLLPSLPIPHPPPPSEIEAEGVGKLLLKWLLSTSNTLRCLRIYSVVQASETFSSVINCCDQLRHLTLSKFDELHSTVEFPYIRSFELDKQFFAYTRDDLALVKRLCFHFPSARVFSLSGCNNDPLVEATLKRLCERKGETFEVYQPSMKLEEVADSVRVRFLVESTNPTGVRNPKSMVLWNERYNSRVLLHRADSVFLTPARSSLDDSS